MPNVNKQSKSTPVPYRIHPKHILIIGVGIIGVLTTAHLVLQHLTLQYGPSKLLFFANIFNVDNESSIPTWFSQFLLALAAIVALSIAVYTYKQRKAGGWQWSLVAAVFLFLSVDEVAVIHEQVIDMVRRSETLSASGIGPWYVYAGLLVLAVGLVLVRFWWRLPRRTKVLLPVAAVVYLIGAVFMDTYGSAPVDQQWLYAVTTATEEGLETFGVLLFVYGLLDYMRIQRIHILLRVQAAG